MTIIQQPYQLRNGETLEAINSEIILNSAAYSIRNNYFSKSITTIKVFRIC